MSTRHDGLEIDARGQQLYTFTVFTPTYNRGHTLRRVYNSLQNQTFRDFEWLIIDDGSTDNTRDLIQTWQKEADFSIRYIYQENRGQHASLNRGVQEARGVHFLKADSDDEFVPEALGRFKFHWDSIPDDQRDRFSAVTALCIDQHGRLVGDKFPHNPTDSDSLEIWYKYRVKGEKWGFQRTDVLRRFTFPLLEGQKVQNAHDAVWRSIAREFKTRYVNEPLRTYWQDEPGRADQVSRHASHAKSAPDSIVSFRHALNHDLDWFWYSPRDFLRAAANYSRFSFHAHIGIVEQLQTLDNLTGRFLWALTLPLGFSAYVADRKGISRRIKHLIGRRVYGTI